VSDIKKQTIIKVTIDWDDDADECIMGQGEIEQGIHDAVYEMVEEACAITTNIERYV
jgi:hypothetical protein